MYIYNIHIVNVSEKKTLLLVLCILYLYTVHHLEVRYKNASVESMSR